MAMTYSKDPSKGMGRMSGMTFVFFIAAVKLLVQLAAAHNYGYFRDELYFIDCSKHLDWGYVDMPPLIALITWLSRSLLGDSLTAIHVFPALAGAAKIILAGLIARELGGGRFAQSLAAMAGLIAPVYPGTDHMLTMNTFEPLFWTGCAYLIIRAIHTGNPRLWLWFGVVAGLGLKNKYSMLFFGFGVFAGLLLTRERKLLRERWVWIAALVALAIFLPNLIWEIRHGFPTFVWLQNHRLAASNVSLTPLQFIGEEILGLQPLAAPVWIGGLWYYLGTRQGKPYRALGWMYLVILALFLALKARVYYLFPVYPILFGAGAVWMEQVFARARQPWLKPAYVTALILTGAVLAPSLLPILPVKTYIGYARTFDLDPPRIENRKLGVLPQLYADAFGWKSMAAEVARAYNTLPVSQRAQTAILTSNYGEAAAIDFFRPKYRLPEAICAQQNYYYWGPGNYTGESLILVGPNPEIERQCTTIEQVGIVQNEYSMPRENFPLLRCGGLKQPLPALWLHLRKWQ